MVEVKILKWSEENNVVVVKISQGKVCGSQNITAKICMTNY